MGGARGDFLSTLLEGFSSKATLCNGQIEVRICYEMGMDGPHALRTRLECEVTSLWSQVIGQDSTLYELSNFLQTFYELSNFLGNSLNLLGTDPRVPGEPNETVRRREFW